MVVLLRYVLFGVSLLAVDAIRSSHLQHQLQLAPPHHDPHLLLLASSSRVVPAALDAEDIELVKQWEATGSVVGGAHARYPELSRSVLAPGGASVAAAGFTVSHPDLFKVQNAMNAQNVGRKPSSKIAQGATSECRRDCKRIQWVAVCKRFYCIDVGHVDPLVTRINHVRASTAIGDVMWGDYSFAHPNSQNPLPEVAWQYIKYVLRSMSTGGVLSQLPMHFFAFAHVAVGDLSNQVWRPNTWNGGGAHLILPFLTHMATNRWNGISNSATTKARVRALHAAHPVPTPLARVTAVPGNPNSGYVHIHANWNHAEIYHGNQLNYVQARTGPHIFQPVAVRRAQNGVLFLAWQRTERNDFLHQYEEMAPNNHWKSIFPENFTPTHLLEYADTVYTNVLAAYLLLPFTGTPNHFKQAGVQAGFTFAHSATIHQYQVTGVVARITVELFWSEHAGYAPIQNLPAPAWLWPGVGGAYTPLADLLCATSGMSLQSTLYPTLANFPAAFPVGGLYQSPQPQANVEVVALVDPAPMDQVTFNSATMNERLRLAATNTLLDRASYCPNGGC